MEYSYKDGAIVLDGKYHEEALYDVSNDTTSVTFNGKGGLRKFSVANDRDYVPKETYLTFEIDGEKIDVFTDKTVEMIGRTQKITLAGHGFCLELLQFVSKEENGVFCDIKLTTCKKSDFGMTYDIGGLAEQKDSSETPKKLVVLKPFAICCSEDGVWLDENHMYYVKKSFESKTEIKFFVSFGESINKAQDTFSHFDELMQKAICEYKDVKIPASVSTEEEKAFYLSCHFCSLENFKQLGLFKAFGAGCNYLNPMRTYFRDSYWTVLPMYNGHTDLVKEQIRTLSRGIGDDGTCPSAVIHNFTQFWGNHFDSPCFFAMMIYDYVNNTDDKAILDELVGDMTLLERAKKVLDKLSESADETGLTYKQGRFNKRDWADEVNRNGYVTYNEVLYARSLYCLSKLLKLKNHPDSEKYLALSERVKKSINELLWDEDKGYYVNYKSREYTEDNLSVDTVIAVIFGVSDKVRSERILCSMQHLLETRNNFFQKGGDYGVMCVYPFYKGLLSAYRKSSQDYFYHNGANWPYLSAVYAYALKMYGKEYRYALTSWFDINVKNGNYTPVEYFSSCQPTGSLLQAWSGCCAFVLDDEEKSFFDSKFVKD